VVRVGQRIPASPVAPAVTASRPGHCRTIDEVAAELGIRLSCGLTRAEAVCRLREIGSMTEHMPRDAGQFDEPGIAPHF
jgi:hypothetical protein